MTSEWDAIRGYMLNSAIAWIIIIIIIIIRV